VSGPPEAEPSDVEAPGSEASSGRTAETRLRVRSYELDSFDHVNHAVFLNWFEQARFEALEQGGLPVDVLSSMGLAVVVVRIEVDYRAEARLGDRVVVRTRVGDVRKTSMTLQQEAVRVEADDAAGAADGTLLAEARVTAVWLREGKPVRVPGDVREALGVD